MTSVSGAVTRIPLVDVGAQNAAVRDEIDVAIAAVVAESAFIGGRFVAAFEAAFAAYCGTHEAVGVSSGTDALYLALRAAGIGPGDEVVTVSHTFAATVEAIVQCGARPVLVDIDAESQTMSAQALAAAVGPRTAAVVPVHLHGHVADMVGITRLADRHGLVVVEDAAQAHGANLHGRRAGSLGRIGCFSFYPGKNLGAMGDAGAITTDDAALAGRVRMLRDHGRRGKYEHELIGVNARLDGLQAAVLAVKLRHLDSGNAERTRLAARYTGALAGVNLSVPPSTPGMDPAWHLYVVRVRRRDTILDRLRRAGIDAGVHYPVPVHLQPAFAHLGLESGALPETERAADEVLSLPLYPGMTDADVDRVAEAVRLGVERE